MESLLIGCFAVFPTILLVMTCLLNRCRKKKTREEEQREMFRKFYKKHMLPSYWGSIPGVDFVRRPQNINLDTTQCSFTGRSEHTYDDISTPKKDISITIPPRSPASSVEKCVIEELDTTNTETNSTCSLHEGESQTANTRWLQTPGQLAAYISFRQMPHGILVVPSATNVPSVINKLSVDNSDSSDSDNNVDDKGSESMEITVRKELNFDCSKMDHSKITNEGVDFNFSSNDYEKDSKKELSKTEISCKTDPTYESIRSMTIPQIRLFKDHTFDHTYESLSSELCFDFGRTDVSEKARDDVFEAINFRRSFESVKSGRDFTLFEINCDDDDSDGNDVFSNDLSINSAHTLRHSYPGVLKVNPTYCPERHRSKLVKKQTGSKSDLEEERYSPFPVARRPSFNLSPREALETPKLCMIQTISGNLRPKSFVDNEENMVLNPPNSVQKFKVYVADFSDRPLTAGHIDRTLSDGLDNTGSVADVFEGIDYKIPPQKTYQILQTIYSQARRAARTKKSLQSLPSVTEQTEMELNQHLSSDMYVKSTPLSTS